MPERFSEDDLRSALAPHVPGADGALLRPIRTGKFNTSYFVAIADREYVLRIAPPADAGFIFYERNMMAQEPSIHQRVLAETDVPVARILAYDTTGDILPRDFLLMERLPGTPMSEVSLAGRHVRRCYEQVGGALAEIHTMEGEGYGYTGEHACMTPADDWRTAFRTIWGLLIDDIESCGGYTGDEALLMRDLLEKNLEIFDYDGPPRLLHMDVWSQNILCDDEGNLTGLIDFDRALWGDPEIEFAVLDYCGISEPEFWQGYGVERDTSTRAAVRQLFYYLYELQKYIVIERLRRNDAEKADEYRRATLSMVARSLGRR